MGPHTKSMTYTYTNDIQFGAADGVPLLLDMYRPDTDSADLFNVVVFIHGGGWCEGDKAGYGGTTWAPFFAQHGYLTVSIHYRLSTTAIFPTQLHDCQLAIRWLRANAKVYQINPEKIGVWGHSAGGHLSMLLAAVGDMRIDEEQRDLDGYSSQVQVAASVAGPTDLLNMGSWHDEIDSPESKLLGGPVQAYKELARTASPINYVNEDTPPILLIHGEIDELVPIDQSERMYQALTNGSMLRVKDMDHGLNSQLFSENDLLQLILAFMAKHF